MIGETLGHYRVLDLLGAGGMGEVYRAEDTTLGREVALKVLPEAFTADAGRLARLEREARSLAAVDHPGIAAIYSFEAAEIPMEAAGLLRAGRPDGEEAVQKVHFLVMQLAEGETLAERITRSPIPVGEAMAIALQIAAALEAAHEKGIIHRDLKPANIKVDTEGQVKILDFGLAKALDPTAGTEAGRFNGAGGLSASPTALSPTLTMPAEMTREGVILGTVGYMSPEQARGRPADKRSDIWAFGCVLYEMLTGKRVFGGETSSDSLARILEREPDWEPLPDDTPMALRTLIRRCLAKDPKQRLHDMADVRLELEEAPEAEALARPASEPAPMWRRALPWVAAAVGVGLAIWALIQPGEATQPKPVTRFSLPSATLALWGNASSPQVAISPDGTQLAYVVGKGHSGQLYLRRLDSPEPVALADAKNVQAPFFSPDGAWVGFHDGREIKRISVEGGKSWTICEAGYSGATWGPDGTVVYVGDGFGLWRVPWDGGEPQRLTTVDREGGEYHANPQFLPGGEAVLFNIVDYNAVAMGVALVDLETGKQTVLLAEVGGQARYLASGHLAYGEDGSLMVVPFDLKARQVTGRPVAVFDGLLMGTSIVPSLSHFAAADNGTLAFVSGPLVSAGSRLVRVDRAGTVAPLGQVEEHLRGPRFSPDGSRLALWVQSSGEPGQVWVRDLDRGTFTRLTLEGEGYWPVWSSDGRRIAFPRRRDSSPVVNLAWIEADGSSDAEWLTQSELSEQPTTWTPDGRTLIYQRNDHPDTGWDVMALEPGEAREPQVLLGSRFYEGLADMSPDGRWLAYVSDESGRLEVYVRSYPDLERKWQISTGGGVEPVWSPDGRELFYRDEEGRAMTVVPITIEPDFSPGRPEPLFEASFEPSAGYGRNYDVAPDGQSFVMVETVIPENIEAELQVVVNWFTELAELVPRQSP